MNALRGWRFALVLGILVAVVYGNSLDGSFHYDDFHSIVDNPHLQSLGNVPAFFTDPALFSSDADKAMYRPLLLVTYALNHAVGEYDVFGYHLVNTALHAGCALLCWVISGLLFGETRRGGRRATFAALVFAVHPLAAEPVNYISGRSDLLSMLFYLATFALHLQWRRRGLTEYARSHRWFALGVLAAFSFAGGLLTKSTVITLPIVLLLSDLLATARQGGRRGVSTLISYHASYWVIAGCYLLLLRSTHFFQHSLASPVRDWKTQLLTQIKAPVYYVKLASLPVELNVEHQFAESGTTDSPVVWVAGLFVLSIATVGWFGRRHRAATFLLLWAAIVILPVSLMPLNVLVNERRMYLALAAFAWFMPPLITRRVHRLSYVWLAALCLTSLQRNAVWENELTLWSDAADKSPLMARPHVHLGNAQRAVGDMEAARSSFRRALELEPGHRAARANLANLYLEGAFAAEDAERRSALLEAALTEFDVVLRSDPDYREALNGKATALSQLGRREAAIEVYGRLLRAHPHFADGYYNMGLLLYDKADYAAAVVAFERATGLRPGDDGAFNELGNAHTHGGNLSRAVKAYRQALQLSPRHGLYARNLGEVLVAVGGTKLSVGDTAGCQQAWMEARGFFSHALRLDPGDEKASRRLQYLSERLP